MPPQQERETPRGDRVDLPPPLQEMGYLDPVLTPITPEALSEERPDPQLLEQLAGRILEGRQYAIMGFSLGDNKAQEEGSRGEGTLVVFRYDDLTTLELRVDLSAEEVLDVAEMRGYQPELSDAELERAVALAWEHEAIRAREDLQLLTPQTIGWLPGEGDEIEPGRFVQVSFLAPYERLPRTAVLVELTRGEVVRSDLMRERE